VNIFKAMTEPRIKQGKRFYYLYDCSGLEVIEMQESYLKHNGRDTIVKPVGNGWWSIYCYPKM
jgi:hypothetical protein